MVNFCAVIGCAKRADRDKGTSFYRLPSIITHQGEQTRQLSERRRREWLSAIRRQDIKPENYEHTRVCSDHFISGKPSSLYQTTHPDWVPSRCLGHNEKKEALGERHARAAERAAKRRCAEVDDDSVSVSDVESGTDVETTLTLDELTSIEARLENLEGEMAQLKNRLVKAEKEMTEMKLDEVAFCNNDEKVNFYTGLPTWQILSILLDHIQASLLEHSSLTPFQQLLMTLMRLRMNMSGQDLAYRFGVHKSTISRIFSHVIDVLYVMLKPLILWPDRDMLRSTMPMDFRKYCPTCAVIIDCFEIFLERPSNLLARAQTYSAYKHHNTVKYLIGITPQGTVCFISEGWGGRVSDKHLTENSGLLNHLLPGDTVLADRGFDIQESVSIYCARVTMPAFTKGKKQLTGIDVEQTRRIANVRIHVERVIGLIRQKYSLLGATQPIDFVMSKNGSVPTLDKIVHACCCLVNFCDSIVPFD